MRQNKSSLNSQIRELRNNTEEKHYCINYEKLINKQKEVIQSLQTQILMLKSYISLEKANRAVESIPKDYSSQNSSTSSIELAVNKEKEEQTGIKLKNYQKIIQQIVEILEIKDIVSLCDFAIIESINKLKEFVNTKKQPIFVERIKEIKVPITVQKIIQKTIQKIVYIDRPGTTQKNVQRPLFKQKDSQKLIIRKNQERQQEAIGLNKTYSEKNISRKKVDDSYREQRYVEKGNKYDNYRKSGQSGNNLIKKRGDVNKYNGYKKQYY